MENLEQRPLGGIMQMPMGIYLHRGVLMQICHLRCLSKGVNRHQIVLNFKNILTLSGKGGADGVIIFQKCLNFKNISIIQREPSQFGTFPIFFNFFSDSSPKWWSILSQCWPFHLSFYPGRTLPCHKNKLTYQYKLAGIRQTDTKNKTQKDIVRQSPRYVSVNIDNPLLLIIPS